MVWYPRHGFPFSLVLTAHLLLLCSLTHAVEADPDTMKRRQQGILTGMPFMSNLAPRTFLDDTGRKVFLAKPPQRIISLAPSITEILFAIGADDAVVGVTEFCNYPPEAALKPRIGDARPNLEAIVALKPDLVLAIQVVRNDVLQTLEQLKIPLFIMEAKSLEHIYSHIQTLGRILDRKREAARVATSMRDTVHTLAEKTQGLPQPRVLYVVYHQPFITVGPGSFIHQLIGLAGGENIAGDTHEAYPRLSMEVILQKNPEVLIFPSTAAEGKADEEVSQWKRWSSLSAVKTGRIHSVPWGVLSRPGPRIPEALLALAKAIHPEVFEGTERRSP